MDEGSRGFTIAWNVAVGESGTLARNRPSHRTMIVCESAQPKRPGSDASPRTVPTLRRRRQARITAFAVHDMTGRLIYQARSRSLLQYTGIACRLWQNFAHRTDTEDSALVEFWADLQRHNRSSCCGLPVAVVFFYPWRGNVAVRDSLAIEAAVEPSAALAADLTTCEKTMIRVPARRIGSSVGCEGCGPQYSVCRGKLSSRS